MIHLVRTGAMDARRGNWWRPHIMDIYYHPYKVYLSDGTYITLTKKVDVQGIGWLNWGVYYL